MFRKTSLYIAFATTFAIFPGCIFSAFNEPLVLPEEAPQVDSIFGVFTTGGNPDSRSYIHVGNPGKDFPPGFVKIIQVDHLGSAEEGMTTSTLIGFLVPVGEYHVLHIPVTGSLKTKVQDQDIQRRWDESRVVGYFMVRLKISGDTIEATLLEDQVLEDNIKDKTLAGQVMSPRRKYDMPRVATDHTEVRITSSTKQLREFFEANIDQKLFGRKPLVFKRLEQ